MATLTITIDAATEGRLQRLSSNEGTPPDEVAARLLRRALLNARPKPTYDYEAIRRNAAEFAAEDLALAESDLEHRAQLLAQEDAA